MLRWICLKVKRNMYMYTFGSHFLEYSLNVKVWWSSHTNSNCCPWRDSPIKMMGLLDLPFEGWNLYVGICIGYGQNGRVPYSFPPLRGTNSTTTNYITSTANFKSNKDNFWTLSSQGLFESIVINLLAAVILGFSTLSGTNPQIWTYKGTTSTPVT